VSSFYLYSAHSQITQPELNPSRYLTCRPSKRPTQPHHPNSQYEQDSSSNPKRFIFFFPTVQGRTCSSDEYRRCSSRDRSEYGSEEGKTWVGLNVGFQYYSRTTISIARELVGNSEKGREERTYEEIAIAKKRGPQPTESNSWT